MEQLDAGNRECLNRNAWTNVLEARAVIGGFRHEYKTRHRHSALGYRTPAEYAATCHSRALVHGRGAGGRLGGQLVDGRVQRPGTGTVR
ncbi:integrase core domain-containing protein [Micromonospora sp. NPDC049559]|uniref:integrase core domain-containing protein n=1 Tax=Micromonospora sp. NPDC049559 TaxID=3155923 RepID=UPI0034215ECD